MLESECRFDLRDESVFWLGILRDHSQFMFMAFPSSEKTAAQTAKNYEKVFSDLQKQVTSRFSDKLAQETVGRVEEFRCFQQDVLNRQLRCGISFNLPPLILEHTIAEAREFLLILDEVIPERNAALQDMHEHLLWLWDFTGHTDIIMLQLDPTEEIILTKAREFKRLFMALFYKSYSYQRMIKPQPDLLSNLAHLNRQSTQTSQDFIDYMALLKKDVEKCEVLGILPPLLLDHMIRETCYYIGKIKTRCPGPTDPAGAG